MRVINFEDMTPDQRQAFADFQLKELCRHEDDCNAIRQDLRVMKEKYNIISTSEYVGKWIEVK